jgi:hypothetical protein
MGANGYIIMWSWTILFVIERRYWYDHYYYLYEHENECKIPRNHCIIVVNFGDNELFDCSIFYTFSHLKRPFYMRTHK